MAARQSGGVPLYRQIYTALLDEIEKGVYGDAAHLPSEKELCLRFGVERNTVRRALAMLVDDGRVVRLPGLGTRLLEAGEPILPPAPQRGAQQNVLLVTQEDYLKSADGEHFHFKLAHSLEREFSKYGFNLIFKTAGENGSLGRALHSSAPVAAVFDSHTHPELYHEALEYGIPCVSVNHHTPLMTSIVSNNFDSACQITRLLMDAGHRKIAYIIGKRNYQTTIERLNGILSTYRDRGIPFQESSIIQGNWQLPSGVDAGNQIAAMRPETRPTAIFALNDDMAFGCLAALEKHGIMVPGGISLVGFDNTDRYRAIFRPITTADVNLEAIVRYACWYLAGRIRGSAPVVPVKISIDATIVDNGTIAAPGAHTWQAGSAAAGGKDDT